MIEQRRADAAAQLGVAPERCTVIEDSPSEGARRWPAACACSVLRRDGEQRLAAAGALTFEDMAELPRLIQTRW